MTAQSNHYQIVQLGTAYSPLPSFNQRSGTNGALASEAGVLNFYTLLAPLSRSGLATSRDAADTITVQERVYGEMMRNLPTRSMSEHFIHELLEADPSRGDRAKHSYVSHYVGPPSIGKSFMVKLLGKLEHPKGALNLNCKDVDMGAVFCETVFDTSAANKEKAALDAKLAQGNANPEAGLKPENLAILRHALGEAYSEATANGTTIITIDWDVIQVRGDTTEQQHYESQVLRETIKQVCESEGITISSDPGQIGITTRDGIAIRAADPNSPDYRRRIVLDEFMRCKPGTAQKLYEYLAMLSDPNVPKFEVIGGGNKSFTFYRRDLPPTYRVNMTDNPAVRGMGSAGMDTPLVSRLGVELDTRTVPDPDLCDYADRIAQTLTGVPLLQIYYSSKKKFDDGSLQLPAVAKRYRMHGLTDAEQQAVPAEQLANIADAQTMVQVAEQLAEFFIGLTPLFNPESTFHSQNNLSIAHEYEEYLRGIEIDLRLVTKLMDKASVMPPELTPADEVDYSLAFQDHAAPNTHPMAEDITATDMLASRGSRLETYILEWLHRVVVPADCTLRGIDQKEAQQLYDAAIVVAANCGIGDPLLREASRGGIRSIGELYDVNPAETQSRLLRDIVAEARRDDYATMHPDDPAAPSLPANNEQMLPLLAFQRGFELAGKIITALTPPHIQPLRLPIMNWQAAAAEITQPALVVDLVAYEPASLDFAQLATQDSLLLAIAAPQTRARTLAALWNNRLVNIPGLEQSDPTLAYAAGTASTGFGITTAVVETQPSNSPKLIHIVKMPDDYFLVMAPHIDSRFYQALRHSPITMIDITKNTAAAEIDKHIQRCLPAAKDISEQIQTRLSDAFLMRNWLAEDTEANRTQSVGMLATKPELFDKVIPLAVTTNSDMKKLKPLLLRKPAM